MSRAGWTSAFSAKAKKTLLLFSGSSYQKVLNLVGMSFCLGVRQAVSLICWALWPFGCQSDMYVGLCGRSAVSLIGDVGLCGRSAVSLICMLGFV